MIRSTMSELITALEVMEADADDALEIVEVIVTPRALERVDAIASAITLKYAGRTAQQCEDEGDMDGAIRIAAVVDEGARGPGFVQIAGVRFKVAP